jgi:hypothetical protein
MRQATGSFQKSCAMSCDTQLQGGERLGPGWQGKHRPVAGPGKVLSRARKGLKHDRTGNKQPLHGALLQPLPLPLLTCCTLSGQPHLNCSVSVGPSWLLLLLLNNQPPATQRSPDSRPALLPSTPAAAAALALTGTPPAAAAAADAVAPGALAELLAAAGGEGLLAAAAAASAAAACRLLRMPARPEAVRKLQASTLPAADTAAISCRQRSRRQNKQSALAQLPLVFRAPIW